jgi:hypothetical protein
MFDLSRLFRGWGRPTRRVPGHRADRGSLRLETLENRLVPTSVTFDTVTDTLTITGDNTDERVTIFDNGTGASGNISVRIGSSATTRINTTIRDIDVNMGAGNDRVGYHLDGDLASGVSRSVSVDLGSGNDDFETVFIRDLKADSHLGLSVYAGTGDDTINASTSHLNVYMDIEAGASLNVLLNGDANKDTMNFGYKGELDGSIGLLMQGGSGDDTMEADLDLRTGSTGVVRGGPFVVGGFVGVVAGMIGGDGNDTMTYIVHNRGTAEVIAAMDGGLGFDTGTRTANVDATRISTEVVP